MNSSYLYLNSLRVHYLRWDGSGSRRTIVLLHGLSSNAYIWQLVGPLLAGAGYTVLAPDARSHGLTDSTDGDYGFETFTQDLAAFIDACDIEKPILVGHSWGANRVLDYAAHRSFGVRAPAGIALVDGGTNQMNLAIPGRPAPTWEEMRDRLTPPRLAGVPLELFKQRAGAFVADWNLDPDQKELLISIVLKNFDIYLDESKGVECIRPHLSFENHMQIVRALWEFNTFEYFDRVRCPVLILPSRNTPHSEEDKQYLAAKEFGVQKALEKISNVTIHWMENSVHDSPLQRPEELSAQIIQFIDSL